MNETDASPGPGTGYAHTTEGRQNRTGDRLIAEGLEGLTDELGVTLTHVGTDYTNETPGGYRRVKTASIERIGTMIKHNFYFRDLDAGELGSFHGRGMLEVAFRKDSVAVVYLRASVECFLPSQRFDHRPTSESAMQFECYYDRDRESWKDDAGNPLEMCVTHWKDDPDRDPDREFP